MVCQIFCPGHFTRFQILLQLLCFIQWQTEAMHCKHAWQNIVHFSGETSFQSSIRVPTVEGTSVYVHMLAHWCMLSSIVSPETCGYESISVVASLPANAHCWNHHDWTAAVLCCVYMCVRAGCAHAFLLCTGTQLLHKLRSRALSVRLHLPHLSSLSLSHTRGTQKSTGSNKLGRQARRKDSEEDLQSEALTEWIYRDILSVPAKSVKAWLEL